MAESTGMFGLRREFCAGMQMVRVYCEKRASYEYVKWEMKQKRERDSRTTAKGMERGTRSVRGKAEIATEVSRNDVTST